MRFLIYYYDVIPDRLNGVLIFSTFNFNCTEAVAKFNSELPFNLRCPKLLDVLAITRWRLLPTFAP